MDYPTTSGGFGSSGSDSGSGSNGSDCGCGGCSSSSLFNNAFSVTQTTASNERTLNE